MNDSMQDHIEQKSWMSFDTLKTLVLVYQRKFRQYNPGKASTSLCILSLFDLSYKLRTPLLNFTHHQRNLPFPLILTLKTFKHDAFIYIGGNIIVSD